MTDSKNLYPKNLVKVLGAAFLLFLINTIPSVHHFIVSVDKQVALNMNSVVGICPLLDHTMAWASTRVGDAFMLMFICSLFFIHSLCGGTLDEVIKRGSFWIWLGILCVIIYGLSCFSECFIRRETPLTALPQLKNLHTIYGVTLRSSPTSSFPSGHGLAYLFFAIMAWRKYPKMALALSCLAAVMLSVRLIVGLHWLSDILLGSMFLVLFLVYLIEDTALKNTYTYVEHTVSVTVRNLLAMYKSIYKPQNEVFIDR